MNELQLKYLESIKDLADVIRIETILDKATVDMIKDLVDNIKIEEEKKLIK